MLMEPARNFKQLQYDATGSASEVAIGSQRSAQDASGPDNSSARSDFDASGISRPILNYSIQTGEEFSLEFYRANSQKIPSRSAELNNVTHYTDQKGLIGVSELGSQSVISSSVIGEKIGIKETERTRTSLFEPKVHSESTTREELRVALADGSSQGSSYRSVSSNSSSTRIKLLCSYGGKILPRPSDGKLRYVGGDTRMLRVNKDICWQDLLQKTFKIVGQPHIIKYQLPGEDLDALVSVSCDEDLQNMLEEYSFLELGDGSQKLRMFLFSSGDIDEMNFGLSSINGDSERKFMVAVNGMDLPSYGSASATDHGHLLDVNAHEADKLRENKLQVELTNITTIPPASVSAFFHTDQESCQTSKSESNVNSNDNILRQSGESDSCLHPNSNFPASMGSRISVPLSMYSDYSYGSPYGQVIRPSVPPDLLSSRLGVSEVGCDDKQTHNLSSRATEISTAAVKNGESELIETSASGILPSAVQHDGSALTLIHADRELNSSAASSGHFAGLVYTKPKGQYLEPIQDFSNIDCETADKVYESNLDDNIYISTGLSDHDENQPSRPSRVFYSERIRREPSELRDRLSKSDDCISSQFLLPHSHSDLIPQDPISESLDPFPDLKLFSQVEVSNQLEKQADVQPAQDHQAEVKTKDGLHPEVGASQRTERYSVEAEKNTVNLQHSMDESGSSEVKESVIKQSADHSHTRNHSHNALGANSPMPASQVESLGVDSVPQKNDIVVDINDRFPPEFLSGIFLKARNVEDSSTIQNLLATDAAFSLNMHNPEPQSWSFFRNLAQGQFDHKDVSLMDQDHICFPLPTAVNEESLRMYGVPPSDAEGIHAHKVETVVEGVKIENPFQEVAEDIGMPPSEYEETKMETGNDISFLDASVDGFDLRNVQIIKNEDLEELKELGSGTFGTVYHGKWRGSDVAIKRIKKSCFAGRSSEQERLTVEFWREAQILSKLHHPNVVAFYGVVQDGPGGTLATVTEFMVNGSLRRVLLDKHLDRRKRLIIAMDAAFGMEYLHSKNIVHFDLKCDNLLVNLKDPLRPICKVGDFGLSKIKRNTLVSGGVRGTLPWMAPELLNGSSNKVSEKVDVFSFGIVMWEILTGEEPYANMHYGAIIGGIVNNTLRPTIPGHCDPEWRRLMEQCWAPDPMQRPPFTEIARRLRQMSVSLHNKAAGTK